MKPKDAMPIMVDDDDRRFYRKEKRYMRGFVASWFFPPKTSAEGLVTFKLLKYSKHTYDVCCSGSELWSYHTESDLVAPNIHALPVETDSIDTWVGEAVRIFEERHAEAPYDFIMTRSMPPESVLFGFAVKEKHPEIRWIASFGDPLARNPYELDIYVKEAKLLPEADKPRFLHDLDIGDTERWEKGADPAIKLLCKLSAWEKKALNLADHYIFPSEDQANYTLQGAFSPKKWVIPHTFDPAMLTSPARKTEEKRDAVVLTYCGYSDQKRSLRPVVKAMNVLRLKGSPALDRLVIRVVGNTPRNIMDMVYNFHLQDRIQFEAPVDYQESLQIMQQSDWLLHLEAFFPELPGGSIFFASKLADYFGAKKPILGICSEKSTAGKMIVKSGGCVCDADDPAQIAEQLEMMVLHPEKAAVDEAFCDRFRSDIVAEAYDCLLEKESTVEDCLDNAHRVWPERVGLDEKLISITIPSYNAEPYLDRCLQSLVQAKQAGRLDVMVVNDGSKDRTREIGEYYVKRYPGIIRCLNKENGGHGSTINTGLKNAKGKYFMVLDSDDWLNTTALDQLIDQILKEKLDEDLLLTHYFRVDMTTGESIDPFVQKNMSFDRAYRFEEIDVKGTYIALANSLFKTELLRSHDITLQERTFYVDVEYILLPVPYVHTLRYLDYSLYRYCVGNVNQSIHLPNMLKRYDHHDRVMRRVIHFYGQLDDNDCHKPYIRNILEQLLHTHYSLSIVADTDRERAMERVKDFDRFLSAESVELYDAIGQAYADLAKCRKRNYKDIQPLSAKSVVKKAMKTKVGHALIFNPVTHRLANSRLLKIPFVEQNVIRLVKAREDGPAK